MPHPIQRRTFSQGIAWSVPAVAVAGAAPALAASHCDLVMKVVAGIAFHRGVVRSTASTTNQMLYVGPGEITVTGLSAGVKVTDIEITQYFEQRRKSESGPGIPFIGDSSSNFYNKTSPVKPRDVSDSNVTTWHPVSGDGWFPMPGSGYSDTITAASNTVAPFEGGQELPAWSLTYDWDPVQASNSAYTVNSTTGCSEFTTGKSGGFNVVYTGVPAYRTGDPASITRILATMTTTMTFSDGNSLSITAFVRPGVV